MNSNFKKITALLLLLALLIPTFAACAGGDTDTGSADTTAAVTTATPEDTTPSLEELYPIPEMNYDGREFNMMILRTGYWGQDYNDLYIEEDTGDAVDSALVSRNRRVEETAGVKLTSTETAAVVGDISRLIKADDSTYEMVQDQAVSIMPSMASTGLLHDITTIEGITLDAPWYNQKAHDSVTLSGKLFMLGGDATASDKQGTAVVMFNKKLAEDFNIPDIYTIVEEGKWTLDTMAEYAKAVTADINGSSELDMDDRFGLIAEDFFGWNFLIASGCKIAEKDENDLPYFTAYNDRSMTVLEKIQNIMYDENIRGNAIKGGTWEAENYEIVFGENRALFHANVLSTIAGYRNMESDFGIIPQPKFDEAQEDYITTISPFVSRFLAFPINNGDTEFIGNVVDLLARFGTDTVKSAYYDVLLTSKVARDDASERMLSLIFDSITYDVGSIFNWGNCWFIYQQHFTAKKDNFSSTWASIEKAANKQIEKTIEKITE
ncbi:MAG: hypothetical protein J6I45_00635 [Clostridia bacterium]|nr:hypothetical protein [Clostridia bacterium]